MISFVYFDVGGVVLLDFSGTNKWDEFKRELGVTTDQDEGFEKFWDRYGAEANTGRDVESLIPLLKEKFGLEVSDGYSLLVDGFVNRFEINNSIWPVIDVICRQCKVGLLTNMYPKMLAAIQKRGIIPNISWDVIVDSSVEGVAKPNIEIFKLAQQRANTKGEEILFVENSTIHVKAAQGFGWQTFLYDPTNPEDSSKKLLALFI